MMEKCSHTKYWTYGYYATTARIVYYMSHALDNSPMLFLKYCAHAKMSSNDELTVLLTIASTAKAWAS